MKLFSFVLIFLITIKFSDSNDNCVLGQPTTTPTRLRCAVEVNAKVNMTTIFFMETSATVILTYTDATFQVISFSMDIFETATQTRCYAPPNGTKPRDGEMKNFTNFQLLNRPFLFSLGQEGQQTKWTPRWKFDKEEYVNTDACLMDFSKSGTYLNFFWPAGTTYHFHRVLNCVKL